MHIYIYTYIYTDTNIYMHIYLWKIHLYKGNTNSKMLRNGGIQSKPCLIQEFPAANAGLLLVKAGKKLK